MPLSYYARAELNLKKSQTFVQRALDNLRDATANVSRPMKPKRKKSKRPAKKDPY